MAKSKKRAVVTFIKKPQTILRSTAAEWENKHRNYDEHDYRMRDKF